MAEIMGALGQRRVRSRRRRVERDAARGVAAAGPPGRAAASTCRRRCGPVTRARRRPETERQAGEARPAAALGREPSTDRVSVKCRASSLCCDARFPCSPARSGISIYGADPAYPRREGRPWPRSTASDAARRSRSVGDLHYFSLPKRRRTGSRASPAALFDEGAARKPAALRGRPLASPRSDIAAVADWLDQPRQRRARNRVPAGPRADAGFHRRAGRGRSRGHARRHGRSSAATSTRSTRWCRSTSSSTIR